MTPLNENMQGTGATVSHKSTNNTKGFDIIGQPYVMKGMHAIYLSGTCQSVLEQCVAVIEKQLKHIEPMELI